jgi:hypothetical protein
MKYRYEIRFGLEEHRAGLTEGTSMDDALRKVVERHPLLEGPPRQLGESFYFNAQLTRIGSAFINASPSVRLVPIERCDLKKRGEE